MNIQRKLFRPGHSKSKPPWGKSVIKVLEEESENPLELKQSDQEKSSRRYCEGVEWGDLVGPLQDMVKSWEFIQSEMGEFEQWT